jgi:hypothetical protein
MKINNLLDKAAMPHNKALQTDSQTAAQFVCL